ncbi:MAG: hypothetical protein U0103_09495 [Candidatus Obscuribacterales bacterium]
MSNQNSGERFFALVMKRILVSLSCVSVIASTNVPFAFADDAVVENTAPSWSDDRTETKAKTEVATKADAKEADAASPAAVSAPTTEVKTEATATAPTTEVKTEATATAPTTEVKTEATATAPTTEVKTEATATAPTTEVKTEATETASTADAKTESSTTESAASDSNEKPVFSADLKLHKTGATDSEQLASMPILGSVTTSEPIVVDNDEAVETSTTIKYEDLPTDEGKTRVKTGARFPVVISSQLTTKTAKKGDPVEARLKYDLKIGDRLIARKGAVVNGHINYSLPARSTLHSLVSPTRWYRNSGCLGISFDEIINDKGEHLPLVAVPARAARVIKNKGEGRELGINHEGQVTGPWSQQLRYKAIRIGLNAALAPAGAFSFGAMPIALGVIGAANPSFAFMKPVGLNVRHRRIKGFVWGALSGVPGSWLIEDTVVKGQEAVIKPGDEFLAEFQQEFTGEPASEATMMPNAKSKVHGEVMPDNKKKGKK